SSPYRRKRIWVPTCRRRSDADWELTAGLRSRGCRGRESNPLETDLQSVTLAALSPRRRSPNRRGVIETLETHPRPRRRNRATGICNTIAGVAEARRTTPHLHGSEFRLITD